MILTCCKMTLESSVHNKWLLSSLTLDDPMDCSWPGSSVHGILQARCWSGLPWPPPGDLPNPGIESASLVSPALAGRFSTTSITWEAHLKAAAHGTWSRDNQQTVKEGICAPLPRPLDSVHLEAPKPRIGLFTRGCGRSLPKPMNFTALWSLKTSHTRKKVIRQVTILAWC